MRLRLPPSVIEPGRLAWRPASIRLAHQPATRLDLSIETLHTAGHRQHSGWSGTDISLGWRRTGAAERTVAATSEAFGVCADRQGTVVGPSSACTAGVRQKSGINLPQNQRLTYECGDFSALAPSGPRTQRSRGRSGDRRPQPPLVSALGQPRRGESPWCSRRCRTSPRVSLVRCPAVSSHKKRVHARASLSTSVSEMSRRCPRCPRNVVAMSNLSI